MAYNKFKIEHLQSKLNLTIKREFWLEKNPINNFEDDEILSKLLKQAQKMYLGSEKARSEFLIAPTLQAFQRRNTDKLSVFSGYELNIDKSLDLNGFCDFILSTNPESVFLQSPIFCIVEAKKMEPELNDLAQCGAEMYAAQIFHEKAGKPQKAVYGCATSGFSWVFMKLENNILSIDPNYIPQSFNNYSLVLNTLQWILEQSLSNS